MLTKSLRLTRGRQQWRHRTSHRSPCSAKEGWDVRIAPAAPGESVTRAICASAESPPSLPRRSWDDVTCFLISRVCLSFTGKRSPTQTMYVSATQAPIETKNPQVNLLVTKWQHVWLLALDRRRKLNDSVDRLEEVLASSIQLYLKCHFVTALS